MILTRRYGNKSSFVSDEETSSYSSKLASPESSRQAEVEVEGM